jgi:cellulose synthase/poly-beta-1,6-N-acetylglucosamine synthase-like glycosyltransferase
VLTVVTWACLFGMVVVSLYGVYQAAVCCRFASAVPLPPASSVHHRFAVLIFARDEERVIGSLLDTLTAQDYPTDRFEVFVTADHCTDDTAGVAAAGGARVLVRTGDGPTGKGAALNWFFANVDLAGFDACVVFDADNLVDPGFLAAMDRQLAAGHQVAVGYRTGKNPSSSWVAGASTAFWLTQSRFYHRPRAAWGLPCTSVGGTGFMFALSVLGPDGWHSTTACEDIEFTLQQIGSGRFVAFAADAVVYDEQPLTLEQSLWQRYRWSVGSVQVMRQQFGTLVRAGLHGRPAALDAALFIIGVPMGGVSALLWIAWLGIGLASGVSLGATVLSVLVSAVTGYLVLAGFAWLVVTLEHARWRGRTRALLGFPVWVFAWMVINLVVLFWRDPTWRVQPHTEDLSLDDVSVRMA